METNIIYEYGIWVWITSNYYNNYCDYYNVITSHILIVPYFYKFQLQFLHTHTWKYVCSASTIKRTLPFLACSIAKDEGRMNKIVKLMK